VAEALDLPVAEALEATAAKLRSHHNKDTITTLPSRASGIVFFSAAETLGSLVAEALEATVAKNTKPPQATNA